MKEAAKHAQLAVSAQLKAPVLVIDAKTKDIPEIPSSDLQLDTKIGSGSFGEVWLGLWKSRRRPVAIKRLLVQNLSPAALSQFKAELVVMHALKSRYILTLLGCCFEPGNVCMVRLLFDLCSACAGG